MELNATEAPQSQIEPEQRGERYVEPDVAVGIDGEPRERLAHGAFDQRRPKPGSRRDWRLLAGQLIRSPKARTAASAPG